MEFRDTRMTPDIDWGSASGGTYRLGNYQNQSEYLNTFTLGMGLKDGKHYYTPSFNADLELSHTNQVVVTAYSVAGNFSSMFCQNIDYDYIYPDD